MRSRQWYEGRVDTGRKKRNGQPIYALPENVKLMRHVVKLDAGCWVWTLTVNRKGYGLCKAFGQTLAHRASWVMHNGTIPGELQVLHHCDNPPCVNPAHLFLGTHADNMADMEAKGRRRRAWGERSPFAKLTSEQVIEIRRRHVAGAAVRALGREFGVSSTSVSRIVRGIQWPHVYDETVDPPTQTMCRGVTG